MVKLQEVSPLIAVCSSKNLGYFKALLLSALLVFLFSAACRFTFLSLRGPFLGGDSADYLLLAQNLRAHGSFSLNEKPPLTPTIRRAPLYPAFLVIASLSNISVPLIAAVIQTLLDSLVAAMIVLLVSMTLSPGWGMFGGLAYAVSPASIFYTTAVLSESFFTALLSIAVFILIIGVKRDRLGLTALAGIFLGLAALTRPIALPVPLLLVVVSLLIRPIKRRWIHYSLLIGCASIVVLPWAIRCTGISERLVLVQGLTPSLFYIASHSELNQQDQEALWTWFATEDDYGRRVSGTQSATEIAAADQEAIPAALQNIRSHPREYVVSRFVSFPYLFLTSFDSFIGINTSFRENWQRGNLGQLVLKLAFLVCFSLIPLLLAVIGMSFGRRELSTLLVVVVWIFFLLVHLPLWVEYRFWVPAIPFMLMSATHGAHWLTGMIRESGRA